jgi:hypothetical protein
MNKSIRISFDFDGCLSLNDVQNEAKKLVDDGYDVIVTTSRMKEHKNQDLYKVVDELGIKTVVFTDFQPKAPYMYDVDLHVDNDRNELSNIARTTSCFVINNTDKEWTAILYDIIKL